jgi:predicted alpha/beta hydrolase
LPASLAPDGAPFGSTHFNEARFPIRGYYVPDDPIATPANVLPVLDLYQQAGIETRRIDSSDLNVSSVGHLRFFHSEVGRPL